MYIEWITKMALILIYLYICKVLIWHVKRLYSFLFLIILILPTTCCTKSLMIILTRKIRRSIKKIVYERKLHNIYIYLESIIELLNFYDTGLSKYVIWCFHVIEMFFICFLLWMWYGAIYKLYFYYNYVQFIKKYNRFNL